MNSDAVGLYIHVPFCRRRCGYCDFTTCAGGEDLWDPYVEAVVRELRHWSAHVAGRRVHSIYFGGGTPSLLGPRRVERMLEAVREGYAFEPIAEITLEANPETLSASRLERLRAAGINRLSMGVQSFQPLLLERLDRFHRSGAVEAGVQWARKAGFDNLSLDLIYGIPGQTLSDWKQDLEKAADLEPEHLSVYELTLEPWTPMGRRVERGQERLPDEEIVIALYEWSGTFLPARGYEHYEISNFARPGRWCIHNVQTWRQGEYVGVGLGAHSHWAGRRFRNPLSLEAYLSLPDAAGDEAAGVHGLRWIEGEAKWAEALILGLRLLTGVAIRRLERRLGSRLPGPMAETLNQFAARGILERRGDCVRLSRRGRLLSDSVFAELVV